MARRCGADTTVDVSGTDAAGAAGRIARLSGRDGGHDVVIESSGSVPGLGAALRAARRGAVVVALGLLPPGDLPVPVNLVVTRELTLVGSFRFVAEIDEAVRLLADGLLVGHLLTHELALSDAVSALEVAADSLVSTKVLLRFPAAPDPDDPPATRS